MNDHDERAYQQLCNENPNLDELVNLKTNAAFREMLKTGMEREAQLIKAAMNYCESLSNVDDLEAAARLLYEKAGLEGFEVMGTIHSEIENGELVEYIRADVAKAREEKLLKTLYYFMAASAPYALCLDAVYKSAGIEKME